jgi:hypothetical protein
MTTPVPVIRLKTWLATRWEWLLQHWLRVIGTSVLLILLLGMLGVFKTKQTKDAAVAHELLTDKQIRGKDRFIAQIKDSIRMRDSIIYQVIQVRDSAVVAAKLHEAKADSIIKTIAHENATPDPDATPERVEQFLTGYRPQAYALPGGLDSLR